MEEQLLSQMFNHQSSLKKRCANLHVKQVDINVWVTLVHLSLCAACRCIILALYAKKKKKKETWRHVDIFLLQLQTEESVSIKLLIT